jgi:Glycosyl transferase family 2
MGSSLTLSTLDPIEVSFVIPCLNEEASIAGVVAEARDVLERAHLPGEVVVVDNGSEDATAERAIGQGARVVNEPRRGYGNAYLAGLADARGRYIVMTDGDGSYDLSRVPEFVARLRNGDDLVIGSRFKGSMESGAMPWSHRWIGNPMLTGMLNLLFRGNVSDAHCGLRALRREVLPRLDLSATGMEFASEMVIKGAKRGLRISEIPVDYRPRVGESKLNSMRDAWRHVRFMLVHSATWLFLVPGVLGLVVGFGVLLPFAVDRGLGDTSWTVPVSILAAFAVIVAGQLIQLGLFARTYAALYLGEREPLLERAWQRFKLEHGLAVAAAVFVLGSVLTLIANFDSVPDPSLGLLGLTLVALGVEGAFGAFFLSILGLSEHARLKRGITR